MPKLCECGCGGLEPIARKTQVNVGHVKGQPQRFIKGHKPRTIKSGDVFGRLTVLGFEKRDKRGQSWYRCSCSCGTKEVFRGSRMTDGATQSLRVPSERTCIISDKKPEHV
jgi:hypothetical protein